MLAAIYVGIGIYSREGGVAASSIALEWATLRSLVLFSTAILSLVIGVAYLAVDRKSSRPASIIIAFAQLGAFVLGTLGCVALARFWWIASGPNPPASAPFPLRSTWQAGIGFIATVVLFVANLWRMRTVGGPKSS